MSIESLKSKELNQSQIDIVTGGDHGDVQKEKSETPEGVKCLYSVGQYVEVYDNMLFHTTTERSQITAITITNRKYGGGCYDMESLGGYYYPLYTVRIEKTGEIREIISDHIES